MIALADDTHPPDHKRFPWMKNLRRFLGEEENADGDVVDAQFKVSCRTNTWEYQPVHVSKLAKNSSGRQINPHQKPLKLIRDIIDIHMRGPELQGEARGTSAYEGVLPLQHEHHFILDACCGSGTTSVAANMLGLGSVAFDR
jgi:DNA modification methylase